MIRFSCTCGTELRLPSVLAGEEGRCPKCRRTLRAPVPAGHKRWEEAREGVPSEDSSEVRIVRVARNPMATRTRALLAFACPTCAAQLRVKVAHAGKAGRCSQCRGTFTIPDRPREEPPEGPRAQRAGWGDATSKGSASERLAAAQQERAEGERRPEPRLEPEVGSEEPTEASSAEELAAAPQEVAHSESGRLRPAREGRRGAPPPLQGREAFRILSVACGCGRRVKAPLARLRAGDARCPTCDELLVEP